MFTTERFFITIIRGLLSERRTEEKGAAMIEYALLVAGIAVVVGVAALTLGGKIASRFDGLPV